MPQIEILLIFWQKLWNINHLNASFTKWSNTLKQFVGKLLTNCLNMFDHFVGLVLKELKTRVVAFLTLDICRNLRISVISSSQWNMSLVSIFWVIWRKVMPIREVPDFWGLHKKYELCVSFNMKNLGKCIFRV